MHRALPLNNLTVVEVIIQTKVSNLYRYKSSFNSYALSAQSVAFNLLFMFPKMIVQLLIHMKIIFCRLKCFVIYSW